MAIADTLNPRITAIVREHNETCGILALGTTSLHTTRRFVAQNLSVVVPSCIFSPGRPITTPATQSVWQGRTLMSIGPTIKLPRWNKSIKELPIIILRNSVDFVQRSITSFLPPSDQLHWSPEPFAKEGSTSYCVLMFILSSKFSDKPQGGHSRLIEKVGRKYLPTS